jgi:hypothetical protein
MAQAELASLGISMDHNQTYILQEISLTVNATMPYDIHMEGQS